MSLQRSSPAQTAHDRAALHRRRPPTDHRNRMKQQAAQARHQAQIEQINMTRQRQFEQQTVSDAHRQLALHAAWEYDLDALLDDEQQMRAEMDQLELEAYQQEGEPGPELPLSVVDWLGGHAGCDTTRAHNQQTDKDMHDEEMRDDEWDFGNETMECIYTAEQQLRDSTQH